MEQFRDGIVLNRWPEVRAVDSSLMIGELSVRAPQTVEAIETAYNSHLPEPLRPSVVVPEAEIPAVLDCCETTITRAGLLGLWQRVRGDKKAARAMTEELAPYYGQRAATS